MNLACLRHASGLYETLSGFYRPPPSFHPACITSLKKRKKRYALKHFTAKLSFSCTAQFNGNRVRLDVSPIKICALHKSKIVFAVLRPKHLQKFGLKKKIPLESVNRLK
ncbi:hypothetical protein POVCU2_0080620 [Plasmodium ovale curtisi]|uniref:Uncharacterized protein n=1 Tax=Plasmodium ovale curtisi TaxID=864141 RepID=A0A1A8WKA9_PLAOA|nr:hypothetical protein POVCU2_0080620 [Plasmodium ovale curtisi]